MNVLRHYSPRLRKISNTFHDINNYKDSNNYSVPHLFTMKRIFLEVKLVSLSIQKKEREKNEIRTIILATQNSMNKKSEC